MIAKNENKAELREIMGFGTGSSKSADQERSSELV